MRRHQVQALLMGGQACVFYGAVPFSKDVDLTILADADTRQRPLLAHAIQGDMEPLRAALDAEVRAGAILRLLYWEPLRREIEGFRREEHKVAQAQPNQESH